MVDIIEIGKIVQYDWGLEALSDLFAAAKNYGFPEDFSMDGVTVMHNMNSGYTFFTNSDYQVCMEDGGELVMWYSTPYYGKEGTVNDLLNDYRQFPDTWVQEDEDYLREICEINGIDFE